MAVEAAIRAALRPLRQDVMSDQTPENERPVEPVAAEEADQSTKLSHPKGHHRVRSKGVKQKSSRPPAGGASAGTKSGEIPADRLAERRRDDSTVDREETEATR